MKKGSSVQVWEEIITIPTYRLGSEDKNPPILIERKNPIHPGSSIIYPYTLQENLTDFKEEKEWKGLVLENEYLRITVLPELGGRVLSVVDRTTGEEALYRNHVLKFARIGIRGAWVSGGIEWNFPNGHTVTTSSPIDYDIRKNEDGSCAIFVGDIERVSRMRWMVGITLYPEIAFFKTSMTLFNRTMIPNRFWFWANSAAPASDGLEFITTASKVMTLTDVMDFPIHQGKNISRDKNHLAPQDLFSLNPRDDFVAWYNHDLKRGFVHYADRFEARGRKFYTWGNSDDGKIWVDLLTDSDGQYSEMQSGRLITQRVWEILEPLRVERWDEFWYPVRGIGSPVYANKNAALSLSISEGKLRIGVHVTSPRENANILMSVNGKEVLSEKCDIDPVKPLVIEKSSADLTEDRIKSLSLKLSGSKGEIIADYSRHAEEKEVRIRGIYKIEPISEAHSAEELCDEGIKYEKLGDFNLAEKAYKRALEDDPDFSMAAKRLGVLYLRRGMIESALSELRRVLERNAEDAEAGFYTGAALILDEQFDEAIEELSLVTRSAYLGSASYLLGLLFLGKGNPWKAIYYLKRAVKNYPLNTDAKAFLGCALRKACDFNGAESMIAEVLKEDPLNFIALAEDFFISEAKKDREKEKLQKCKDTLRSQPQSYLELSIDYGRVGIYDEAIRVLSIFLEDHEGDRDLYPLIHYYMGYWLLKAGERDKALRQFGLGATMDPNFVFPHRIESERVLKKVIDFLPEDGKAWYYLGNLLCSRGRNDEAVGAWKCALKLFKNFSVLHRNIGKAYWKALSDPDRAVQEYEKAVEIDPKDYKLYSELDELYAFLGLNEKRSKLIEGIPGELRKNDIVAERIASYYTDTGEFDRALEILRNTKFYPWEAYTEGRRIYVDANTGKGISLMREGRYREAIESFEEVMKYPRNIGVGEPAMKGHAEALYLIGLCFEKIGDVESAISFWKKASEEVHPEGSPLLYSRAMALKKIGKSEEAEFIFNSLLKFAEKSAIKTIKSEAEKLFLMGLAYKGKGLKVKAKECFRKAFALDCSHRRSGWELTGLTPE